MKIKEQCTATLKGNHLSLRGTDITQWFDIFSDGLSQLPYYIKGIGFVSLGAYLQAKVIYNRYKDQLNNFTCIDISGHSLGSGVGLVIALLIIRERRDKPLRFNFELKGSLKVLGNKAKRILDLNTESIDYQVRYRDPVPYLGWWNEPIHSTSKSGDRRKWLLDFDLKEHMGYWSK